MKNLKISKPGGKIDLVGVYNTRDLGGYVNQDGRRIAPKRLIRSGDLKSLTKGDIRILTKEYNLKKIVDFRTNAEMQEKPDPKIDGVQNMHIPVLSDAQMGMTREGIDDNHGFMDMMMEYIMKLGDHPEEFGAKIYPRLVTDSYPISQYRKFFEILLEQEEGAVLWHCTAGKDRVGTGTALLLSALNVERETIIKDYMLTNEFIQPETDKLIAMVSERTSDEKVLRAVRVLNSVSENSIQSIFTTIDQLYGSMERFFVEQLGLTLDKRIKLHDKYLVS